MTEVDWLDMLNGTTYEVTAHAVNEGWLQPFLLGFVTMLFGLVVFAEVDVKQTWCLHLLYILGGVLVFPSSVRLIAMTFSLTSLVGSWQSTPFPGQVTDIELAVARQFNSQFGGTQSHYVCDQASLNELLKLNFGRAMMTNTTASSVHSEELVEACLERYGFNITEESPTWGYMCGYCVKSDQFEQNEGFYNWTQDNCDHNAKTLSWCAVSLNATDTGSIVTNSPFAVCREPFLDHMHYWSRNLVAWSSVARSVYSQFRRALFAALLQCSLPLLTTTSAWSNTTGR
ncbi:hypothetical protein Poli38472_002660 [Pythium oligandrum]|uniref:Uncharacterized protein n=1 Tax=Pythium oligandrum TaxID=41045 RepID=A0A8K1FK14_PYTOL|nr:hypothetical protein Poli38472_002660 [Pythium oligandrum]|eukprot:TMW63719.1 hypothetical protein Poli38472_002660 [Pythium oligandrum]